MNPVRQYFFKRLVLAKVLQKVFAGFLCYAEHAVFDSHSKEKHDKNSNWCLIYV